MTALPGPDDRGRLDVFVIGAMKSATTGLCEWLDAQPGIVVANPKEPSIFVSDEAVEERMPYVETLFDDAAADDVRVDGSTDYAKFPAIDGVPERVHRAFPEAKVVYMMRHPVERLVSQYRFEWFLGNQKRPLDTELDRNPQLIENSRYAEQLTQWLRFFPPDQILLVFAEAFAHDPQSQVRRVMDLVGVSNAEVIEPARHHANETSALVRPTLVRRIYRRTKVAKKLRPLVPQQIVARYRVRLDRTSRPEMTGVVRHRLETTFDADLERLNGLTGGPLLTCDNWDEIVPTCILALNPPESRSSPKGL